MRLSSQQCRLCTSLDLEHLTSTWKWQSRQHKRVPRSVPHVWLFFQDFSAWYSRPFLNLPPQPSTLPVIVTSTINWFILLSTKPTCIQQFLFVELSAPSYRAVLGNHTSSRAPGVHSSGQDTIRIPVIPNWSRGKYTAPKTLFALMYRSSLLGAPKIRG